jgi:cholesterol oxidase
VEHVDVVVVGSGFGGSVTAYRMAEAGRSVVLLERGRPYPPGSFARSPQEMGRAMWDPSEGLYGLFDVWSFDGCDSLVSSGLGGGSLIYANVLLRKDERWFVKDEPIPGGGYESWPISRADLDPHYDAVERMLGATPYPLSAPAFTDTLKTHAMIQAAEKNGLSWQLPPLAVSFAGEPGGEPAIGIPIVEPAYGNIHGRPRRTCRLIGECDIGCNEGAKNSLDHTYLSAAHHHGADIRTRCEVRRIAPLDGGGYEVAYVRHDPAREGQRHDTARLPLHLITCDRLVLGAGTYGTTYLLLRNRAALPGLSSALGTRFSGNGDLLTFLLPHPGSRARRNEFDASHGPVITTAIRLPDSVDRPDGVGDTGRGFYIEDGGFPGFVDWLAESSRLDSTAARFGEFLARYLLDRVTRGPESNFGGEVSRLVGSGTLSAGSLPLLGMGRDIPDGRMKLRDRYLDVEWTTRTSLEYFARVRQTMQQLSDTLGTEYVDNPIWFFRRIVTVHPVGGAPMGHNDVEGVCDQFGEVYHHPGLFIADASVMPGPVGTNPSLTIAAHADRMSTHILEQPAVIRTPSTSTRRRYHDAIGEAPAEPFSLTRATAHGPNGVRRAWGPPDSGRITTLSFTEEMVGYCAFDETDPATGSRLGRSNGQRLMFHLTITAGDVDEFLSSPAHPARAEGWVGADSLGGRLRVERGSFNLFTNTAEPRSRYMLYRLFFTDGEGTPLTLSGRKEVRDDGLLRVWHDTSTLYFRILGGHIPDADEPHAPVIGAGMLHIRPVDFARQLTTLRASGPKRWEAMVRFGQFFTTQLWSVYGPKLTQARGDRARLG